MRLGVFGHRVLEHFDVPDVERLVLRHRVQAEAVVAVHDDALVPVRQAEQLENHADRADLAQILLARILVLGDLLRNGGDDLGFATHRLLEQRLALGPADVERDDGAGKTARFRSGRIGSVSGTTTCRPFGPPTRNAA